MTKKAQHKLYKLQKSERQRCLHDWCWLAEFLLLGGWGFRDSVFFSSFSCSVSVFHLFTRGIETIEIVKIILFARRTTWHSSSVIQHGVYQTSVSFLSNSSSSASLIWDLRRTSRFFWEKEISEKMNTSKNWQFSRLTFWTCTSVWQHALPCGGQRVAGVE